MKTKIILILTIALAVGGCKTVKQTEMAKQTKKTDVTVSQSYDQNNDVNLNTDNSLHIIENSKVDDNCNVSEIITEEITRTEFSPPDSTGKQYPTSQTQTKKQTKRDEHKNFQEDKKHTSDNTNKSNLRDKSNSKFDARNVASEKTDEKQKVTTTTKPATMPFLTKILWCLALVGGLVLSIYLFPGWPLKAFKWILKIVAKVFKR